MRFYLTALAASAAIAASPAAAGTLNLQSGPGGTTGSTTAPGDYYFGDGTVNLRVSAWSIDTTGTIREASIGRWDYGLGVEHSGDSNHTVDNNGWKDFIVLQFSNSVELVNGTFYSDWDGLWDTDATIGYGSAFPTYTTAPGLAGTAQSGLNSLFTLYGSYDGTGNASGSPDSNTRDINPNNKFAKTWLIGAAFDPNFYDGNKDGFKLKTLTYNVTPAIPEPSTWALFILGFGAMGAAMRKRKQAKISFA